MSERDLDAEFERIIAGWDDEAPDPQLRADGDVTGPSTERTDGGSATAEPGATEAGAAELGATTTPGPEPVEAESGPSEHASPALGTETGTPTLGTDPAAPAGPPAQPGGVLGLPVAPTTSHAWRGSGPQRDDVDDLLDAVDPDDDHFVPPSEIELPSAETDPMYWAIVVGLAGGPLLLLWVLLFDREGSGWWIVTGLAMTVVGFVLLVLRGGTERDPFDDGTRV